MDNAIKYTNSSGNVTIVAEAGEMFCTIKMRDDGIGIDEAEQSRIFSAAFTVRLERGVKEPGVGIGLYLSRQIIAAQDGFIKVYSKLGEGALFSVLLPRINN